MPSKKELEAQWNQFNKNRQKENKSIFAFAEWYKQKYNVEPPSFIKEKCSKEVVDDTNIHTYILSKIGIEPNASGSKRRWHFLRVMAKHIYQQKSIDLNNFFKWTTAHCQCMKRRTLREDYVDTLERLDFITFDLNSGKIEWKPENNGE